MARNLLKRVLSNLAALLIFQTFLFFALQWALPGDYVSQFALSMSREEMQQLRQALGIDQPLWTQYWIWLSSLFTGSPPQYRAALINVIRSSLPGTFLVFGSAVTLAFTFGVRLGKWAAWRRAGLASDSVTLTAVLAYASFPPWLVILFTYILKGDYYRGPWPLDPSLPLWRRAPWTPQEITLYLAAILLATMAAVLILNWFLKRSYKRALPWPLALLMGATGLAGVPYILGFGPYAGPVLGEAAFAIAILTLLLLGELLVLMRSSLEDVRDEPYITTARAKGLSESAIRDRHAARTALLPVASKLVISLPYMMGIMMMVESATGWFGLGSLLFGAAVSQYMPSVMAGFLAIGLFTLAAGLLIDIVQVVLDPRLRSS